MPRSASDQPDPQSSELCEIGHNVMASCNVPLESAIMCELRTFCARDASSQAAALFFPAMNSFSRFCLHRIVHDHFPNLISFSVDSGKKRRSIVCHKDNMAPAAPTLPDKKEAVNSAKPAKSVGSKTKRLYLPPSQISEVNAADRPLLRMVKALSPYADYGSLESGYASSADSVADLPNVVEMYDFPASFKTSNLQKVLDEHFKPNCYIELKWVDDTHALAVFQDQESAMQALGIIDDQVKFRPFWAASTPSHAKAKLLKMCPESTTSKPRPSVNMEVAKRMMLHALGSSVRVRPDHRALARLSLSGDAA